MSNTHRRNKRRPQNKEDKVHRKPHYRKSRRAAKQAIAKGEEIDPFPFHTEGWLTH